MLVDAAANTELEDEIREAIEDGDARITDLHVWQVGRSKFAAIVAPGRRGTTLASRGLCQTGPGA